MDGGDIFCLSILSGIVQVPCHARAAEFLMHYNRYLEGREMEFEIISFCLGECLDEYRASLFLF